MKNLLKSLFLGLVVGFLFIGVMYPRVSVNKNIDPVIEPKVEEPQITLLFTGDMMFDRAVRKTINKSGFDTVFGDSKQIFANSGADLVIANLEGPITSLPSRILRADGTTSKELNFTFQPETAKALKDHNVDIVNLANNHTANQGADGLSQTKRYLNEAGVVFFGSPGNKIDELSTTTCKDNFCTTFIGFHEFAGTPSSDISEEIKRVRSTSDIVIVLPHWGVEYRKQPTDTNRARAREWIDAGADMIIGTHPHIVESIEEYKGKIIFYSLGNFIFDQYFSFDTTHGLTIAVTVTKESFKYDLYPIRNVGTVVSIPNASTSASILSNLAQISASHITSFTSEDIIKGTFSIVR